MAKATDRKGKAKDAKATNEALDALANFTLPDSLPCSEIEFPILIRKSNKVKWQDILNESNRHYAEIEEFIQSKEEPDLTPPFQKTECEYITKEVFVYLIPALEETLNKAKIWEAITRQRCFFNGIDWIAQFLWNNNPRYPNRKLQELHLFNMPWVRKYLAIHPRPYYPKSWLWPEDYAATLIQKTVKQYFVQREEEVQEMREFWRKLELERQYPNLEMNPYLARKFASQRNIQK